ncbi:hypothetical protein OTB20_19510 [Streptomyces sp. H27-H1]|uniref:hypothetical protein n=1 Tax=Streptomyces sp. H27-H1 TaxID=2996461 RepID=UPI00226E7060|nr:hypothetical protein [Streptomyces sp. H27-H1]MCY0928345.1 hypothetical protein [Streptomyces sp. H27-H1]
MTGQLELWWPGWDIEPCDTAAPAVPAGRHPYANIPDEPRAYRKTITVGSVDAYEPGDLP